MSSIFSNVFPMTCFMIFLSFFLRFFLRLFATFHRPFFGFPSLCYDLSTSVLRLVSDFFCDFLLHFYNLSTSFPRLFLLLFCNVSTTVSTTFVPRFHDGSTTVPRRFYDGSTTVLRRFYDGYCHVSTPFLYVSATFIPHFFVRFWSRFLYTFLHVSAMCLPRLS